MQDAYAQFLFYMSFCAINKIRLNTGFIWNHLMVRSLDKRWNIFMPSLCKLIKGLEGLGLVYQDGEIVDIDIQENDHVYK